MTNCKVVISRGREKSLQRKHPWVFSGAIDKIEGKPKSGETVEVVSIDGAFLAHAAFSPESRIRARIWSFDRDESIDGDFIKRKIYAAFEGRGSAEFDKNGTDSYRIVFSESDGLPGIIADRYGSIIVLQLLSAGADVMRADVVKAFSSFDWCRGIYERSDADVRDFEGLTKIAGRLWGDIPENNLIEATENGLKYEVDIAGGHKTGFYLDQRDSRQTFRAYAAGAEVLNCFSYTGGFTVAALAGGAESVVSIDSSAPALEIAKKNVSLNGLSSEKCEWVCEDAFDALRKMVAEGRRFDLIAMDPPKFASTREQLKRAERAYKDVNMQALKLLKDGGKLFTFSCSGAVAAEDFQRYVAWAALDAGVDAQVIGRLSQPMDHPVALRFPESEYLKGQIVKKAGSVK